ncbi:hypothetical protein [Paracoccus marcusii]|uniref:hypothetical protein n=1 Tax=Paracoccus marcusii TaxID=59779 RepID=UPI003735696F
MSETVEGPGGHEEIQARKNRKVRYGLAVLRNEKIVGALLLIQFCLYGTFIYDIIDASDTSKVSEISAKMITLGVLGIGVAKLMTDKVKNEYYDHLIYSDIYRVMNMATLSLGLQEQNAPDLKSQMVNKSTTEFFSLMDIRDDVSASISRNNRIVRILWGCELFFIATGTLYGGYGNRIYLWLNP